MEILDIAETRTTPNVHFDLSQGTLLVKGNSIPENAADFYQPIMDAIARYEAQPKEITTLNFALFYFNTSSSKCILKILSAFSDMNKRLTKVKVNWYYDTDDEDQLETANDLESSCSLEFKYIGVEPDENNQLLGN